MAFTIAVTGKGGTGKTTLSAIIVSRLVASGRKPVLAVDADPNSCLDRALGVSIISSVGSVREDARKLSDEKAGIAKRELLELKIAESLVEANDFDLISMGRPEGPGCYCYSNNVLGDVIKKLTLAYPYMVIDNEAGLENLSRRIVTSVDCLVMATDTSKNGIETVKRLFTLAKDMGLSFKKAVIFANRTRSKNDPDAIRASFSEVSADGVFIIPDDENILKKSEMGISMMTVEGANPAAREIDRFIQEYIPGAYS